MPKRRLGVALLLPPPVEGAVDALRAALDDGSLERIPAHCTLVPPVNVRDEHVPDAIDVLRAAAAHTRPFSVTWGPPATFLPDTPVLYLPAAATAHDDLQRVRDRVFRPPLARALTWPFVPHVTLADEMDADRIAASLVALAGYRAEVTFTRVHLLEEGAGRVWRPIADVAFAAPAIVGRGGLELELATSTAPDAEARAFAEREWPVYDTTELGLPSSQWQEPFAITARRRARVVGLAEGWTLGGVANLSGLMVAAEARGEGIGSHLLAAFESLAAERDCPRLSLRTVEGSRAEAFYRGRGWVDDGRLRDWWYGRTLVQLRRDLSRTRSS